MRPFAIVLLAVTAAAHLYLAPEHLDEMPYVGVLFLLGGAGSLIAAGWLLLRDTPLAWAAHGSRDNGSSGDHVGVAERLVAAGAEIEPRFLELADGPLADWLQSRSIASPNE